MEKASHIAVRQDDPAAHLSADELLDCVGPSWSSMTSAQRAAYGPVLEPVSVSHGLTAIGDLIDLVLDFPESVRAEGLGPVARRWNPSRAVVALAEQLDHEERLDALPIAIEAQRRPAWERRLALASGARGAA